MLLHDYEVFDMLISMLLSCASDRGVNVVAAAAAG
jgi:hypothetical protein